jgi:hypothetical protein
MAIKFDMMGAVSHNPAVLQHVLHRYMVDDTQLTEPQSEPATTAICTASHILANAADAAAVIRKVPGEDPRLFGLRSICGS